jgi:hypothetical protein
MMGRLPFNPETLNIDVPHVVLLGAGASLASWLDSGEFGPKPLLMNELFTIPGVEESFGAAGAARHGPDFEAEYSAIVARGGAEEHVQRIEGLIRTYFESLLLPETPTLYDYLVLALRRKDIVASFNWDPYLRQAYRRCVVALGPRAETLPEVVFLHGNVSVGVCSRDKGKGWLGDRCQRCHEPMTSVPLLYPVADKHYAQDPLIQDEWKHVSYEMSRAYQLAVYGYAAPATDIAAKDLLLSAWSRNPFRSLLQVEIINIEDEQTSLNKWAPFVTRDHVTVWDDIRRSTLFRFPRRSCEGFAAANLRCNPWWNNYFPEAESLDDLVSWLEPLLAEEERGETFRDSWGQRGPH